MTLHTEYAELDDLGRGRFRQTISLKPIAYRKDGSLRRIGNAWGPTGDSAWPMGVDELCDVRINPRIAGKSPLLHFGRGSQFVRFSLVGANNVAGQVSGGRVFFPNAWDNADLEYIIGEHRLQESVYLRAGHPRTFEFIIQEHAGFDPATLSFGSFRILDPTLEPPVGSDKLPIALKWIVSSQGGKFHLKVTLPDGDWAGWTLDPTLTQTADTNDTVIQGASAVWATARGTAFSFDSTTQWPQVGTRFTVQYLVYRDFLKFDTSTIPVGSTINQVNLQMVCIADGSTELDFDIQIVKQNWSAQDPIAAGNMDAAYDACLAGTADDNIWRNTAGIAINTVYTSGNLNTAWVVPGGNTYYSLRSSLDFNNVVPTGNNYIQLASSNHVTAAYRPKLVVDYTEAAGLLLQLQNHGVLNGGTL